MIKIENTQNLTGVKISGSFDDLYELVEALYKISVDEFSDKHKEYINVSTRMLGLSYDIRHAYQGDRDIELIDNGMDKETMKLRGEITPDKNVIYSCNYLYPEMFFCMAVINELIILRVMDITKAKYVFSEMLHPKVVWDKTISVLRSFQCAFSECVRDTLSEQSYRMWLKAMTDKDIYITNILRQYVDLANIDYIKLDKEQRLKNFLKFTRKITNYNSNKEYAEILQEIYDYAGEHDCDVNDIRIGEYPEVIDW